MRQRNPFIVLPLLLCILALAGLQQSLPSGALVKAEAGNPPAEQVAASESLPDLDMTYIERDPMYLAYCVDYHWEEVPGMPGKPYLCPGTENERRWPEPGEIVTFTAHIANKGSEESPAFGYAWLIDGAVAASGMLPPLGAGEQITATYYWAWAHGLVGWQPGATDC